METLKVSREERINLVYMLQLLLDQDVYVTSGGRSSWRLAAMFASEYVTDDPVAAGAYISVIVLWKLAVPSSFKLASVFKLSKYNCFGILQSLAPHAMALLYAGA